MLNQYVRVLDKTYSRHCGMVGKVVQTYLSVGEEDFGKTCYSVEINMGIDCESKMVYCYEHELETLN